MTKIDQVLHSGNSHATINRDPNVLRGELGVLDLKLSAPDGESREFVATELHPRAEQLFSGAWSACYISAFEIAASLKKVTLPKAIIAFGSEDFARHSPTNLMKCSSCSAVAVRFTENITAVDCHTSG